MRIINEYKIKRGVFSDSLSISFGCPGCDSSLSVEEDSVGGKDECPSCGIEFRLNQEPLQVFRAERKREAKVRAEKKARIAAEKKERKEQAKASRTKCASCEKIESVFHHLCRLKGKRTATRAFGKPKTE